MFKSPCHGNIRRQPPLSCKAMVYVCKAVCKIAHPFSIHSVCRIVVCRIMDPTRSISVPSQSEDRREERLIRRRRERERERRALETAAQREARLARRRYKIELAMRPGRQKRERLVSNICPATNNSDWPRRRQRRERLASTYIGVLVRCV